jgi:CHAD domain-containing protein
MDGDTRNGGKRKSRPKDDTHVRELTAALRDSLGKCADDPDVDAVHDTRTGTRRIEAALETALRNAGNSGDPLVQNVRTWERLLKRIRRAASPVRDLDVQRKLMKKLVPVIEAKIRTPIEEPESGMAGQVDKLDRALKSERDDCANPLKKSAAKWAGKLDKLFESFAAAQPHTANNSNPDVAAAALDSFARLATRMRHLDAGNLHEFRKGAKKARYMAESAGHDEHAQSIGNALKKVQDEIGAWHDWLLLAEQAHKHLRQNGARLASEIERMRDAHFEIAIKMERKVRRRLMREWLKEEP